MASSPCSPVSPINVAWLKQRPRNVGAGRYIFKMAALAVTCMFLGYSVSNLYADDGGPPRYPNLPAGSLQTLETGTGLNTAPADHNEYHEPVFDRTSSGTSTGSYPGAALKMSDGVKQSLYTKWSDKLSSLSPWPKDNNEKSSTIPSPTATPDETLNHLLKNGSLHQTEEEVSSPPSSSYGGIPVVGKVTIVTGGESSVYERALRTHEAHNRIHSYPMHVLRQSILNDVWSKPAYILSVLLRELARPKSERLQWLLWVDADTIILNPYVPAEMFLPPAGWENVHLLVSHDWNGLNNGVFPIRVHAWSVNLLTAVLAYPHYKPESHLTWRDQSAMAEVLKHSRFAKHTLQAPQRWFNAYQGELNETIAPFQVRRGDFLVHFAGVMDRDERMEWWLQRAETHSDEWEVELRYTSYRSEVKEFWRQMEMLREEKRLEVVKASEEAKTTWEMVEMEMMEHRERLGEQEKEVVVASIQTLRNVLEDVEKKDDVESIRKGVEHLRNVSLTLDSRKLLFYKTKALF